VVKGFRGVMIGFLVILLSIGVLSVSEKYLPSPFNTNAFDVHSPGDWIKEDQIKVYSQRILINIPNASWSSFTDTNSMDPFLDIGANAIQIKPVNPFNISSGDIISFNTTQGLIVHRVIERGEDELGTYYIVKGDNNPLQDPQKVRFEQITGVVVAIIY